MAIWRRAAPIAFVGWYLIIPPPLRSTSERIQPRSRWTVVREFDDRVACESARAGISILDPRLEAYRGLPAEEIYEAQCVAADNPRLQT